MLVALDAPAEAALSDPLSIRVEGWIHAGERHGELVGVAVMSAGAELGRTQLLFPRSDVSTAIGVASSTRTGFSLLLDAPALIGQPEAALEIAAVWADGSSTPVFSRLVRLAERDYRAGDWGILLQRDFPHLVRREHMYNSGPSLDAPSPELLRLLARYLPPSPARVLDVGCGRGPYAEPLRDAGYDWMGAEIKAEDCATLAAKGLPHVAVDGRTLPFAAGAFAAAMCVEVLEHVPDPWTFLTEVRRVVTTRLLVSVPNLEVVPYWRPHLAVPWHLLESDHRNFFSRASLRELLRPHFRHVEVIGYGEAPLRTAEGAAVDYHLLAIASV